MPNQLLTLRPNTTVTSGSWSLLGAAASFAATLADDVDTNSITSNANIEVTLGQCGFPMPTLPPCAKIARIRLRLRLTSVLAIATIIIRQILGGLTSVFTRQDLRVPLGTGDFVDTDLGWVAQPPGGGEWNASKVLSLRIQIGKTELINIKIARLYLDIEYNVCPSVDVTAPTGTVTDTQTPTVVWTYSDTEEDPQEAFEAVIYSQAQYSASGFQAGLAPYTHHSGEITSVGSSHTITAPLSNGVYRAYLRARQRWGGQDPHWSAYDFSEFTVSVTPPPAPAITATPDNTLNRVSLSVTAAAGAPSTGFILLETSADSGFTWTQVRGGERLVLLPSEQTTLFDYEATPNTATLYRARAGRTLNGIDILCEPSSSVSATVTVSAWWLKDPLDPTRNTTLKVRSHRPVRRRAQGVYLTLGTDDDPGETQVLDGALYGQDGDLELIFLTSASWEAFKQLRATGRTLLLQSLLKAPHAEQHYVRLGDDDRGGYLPIDGTVIYRAVALDYREVPRP